MILTKIAYFFAFFFLPRQHSQKTACVPTPELSKTSPRSKPRATGRRPGGDAVQRRHRPTPGGMQGLTRRERRRGGVLNPSASVIPTQVARSSIRKS